MSGCVSKGNDFETARQAAFAAVFNEYDERYGAAFQLAWHFDTNPTLDDLFLESLAHRLEGRSVREIGKALAPTQRAGWANYERAMWVGALGSWALHPLADRDRAQLVGITHILGLDARARSLGLRW